MNVRFTLMLAVVFLLVGGYVYLYQIRQPPSVSPKAPWFYDLAMEDINYVHFTYQNQAHAFTRTEDHTWFFDMPEKIPVDMLRWSGVPLLLSGPRSSRLLFEHQDNPSKYGLDPPLTTINIGLIDGRSFTVFMGTLTPDENNHYVQIKGQSKVFLVTESWGAIMNRLVTEPPFIPTPTPTPEPTPSPSPI